MAGWRKEQEDSWRKNLNPSDLLRYPRSVEPHRRILAVPPQPGPYTRPDFPDFTRSVEPKRQGLTYCPRSVKPDRGSPAVPPGVRPGAGPFSPPDVPYCPKSVEPEDRQTLPLPPRPEHDCYPRSVEPDRKNLAMPPDFPYCRKSIEPEHRRLALPPTYTTRSISGMPQPYIASVPAYPCIRRPPSGLMSPPYIPSPTRTTELRILPNVTMSPDLHTSFKLGVYQGQDAATEGKNFVYSPLSMRTALGLLAGLLDGKDQLTVLSFVGCSTLEDMNTTSASLIRACCPSNNEAMLKISLANGVWTGQSSHVEPSVFETCKSIYKAFVKQVHFPTQYREVRKEVNDWIEKQTSGLIETFLPENIPDQQTSFVLANALYFKGTWDLGFDINDTKADDFYLVDGGTRVKVSFMTCYSRDVFYSSNDGLKSVVLPYLMDDKEDRRISLHILLPEKKDGLIDLAKNLASNPSFLDNHLAKVRTKVDLIKIPKFRISSKFEATRALKKMGLSINQLRTFHGATIEVDEKGTVASATTCMEYAHGSLGRPPPPPKTFVADRPFIYAIREDTSGAILFFGHVVNPAMD